jgi:hypothetical protein
MTDKPTVLDAHGKGWSDDHLPPNSVYVGREVRYRRKGRPIQFAESKWHNRFKTADEHRTWLFDQPALLAALPELYGTDLICWCAAPNRCNADVLRRLAEHAQCLEKVWKRRSDGDG